jgi:hypothetical protein
MSHPDLSCVLYPRLAQSVSKIYGPLNYSLPRSKMLERASDCGAPLVSHPLLAESGRMFSAPILHPRNVGRGHDVGRGDDEEASINLFAWLPAMFALGLASMGVCFAFTIGSEHI